MNDLTNHVYSHVYSHVCNHVCTSVYKPSYIRRANTRTSEWSTSLVLGGGLEACNGVVFVVDRVLLPVDLDGKLNRRRGIASFPFMHEVIRVSTVETTFFLFLRFIR